MARPGVSKVLNAIQTAISFAIELIAKYLNKYSSLPTTDKNIIIYSFVIGMVFLITSLIDNSSGPRNRFLFVLLGLIGIFVASSILLKDDILFLLGIGNNHLNIERREDCLKIEIPWFRGRNALYGIFTLITSIVLFGIGIWGLLDEGLGFICTPLAFLLAFPLGLTSLMLIFNKTEIKVNKREVIVRHGPIPSPVANISLAISELGQLSINEKRQRGRYGNETIAFQLLVHDKSTGRNVSLIKGRRGSREVLRIRNEVRDFIQSLNSQ
jgi:hypothetical protein